MPGDTYTFEVRAEEDTGELEQVEDRLDDVDAEVERVDDSMEQASDSADQYTAALAGGLAGGVMDQAIEKGGELVGVMVEQTQQFIKTTGEIQRNAQAAGVTAERYQKLQFGFEQVGLEGQDLSEALNTVAERSFDAQSGAKGMVEDFRSLGITVDDLKGKSPAEVFELIAEGIGTAESDLQAAKGATSLLGDELAQKLLPRLRDNADAFDDFGRVAERTGNILEEDALRSAEKTRKKFKDLKVQAAGLRKEILQDLIPALADMAEQTTEVVREFQEVGIFAGVSQAARTGTAGLLSAGGELGQDLAGQLGLGSKEQRRKAQKQLESGLESFFQTGLERESFGETTEGGSEAANQLFDQASSELSRIFGGKSGGPGGDGGGGGGGGDGASGADRLTEVKLRQLREQNRELEKGIVEQQNRQLRQRGLDPERVQREIEEGEKSIEEGEQILADFEEARRSQRREVRSENIDLQRQRRQRRKRRERDRRENLTGVGQGVGRGFQRGGEGVGQLVQMQERGARAAAIHNRKVSKQVQLYSKLGSGVGGVVQRVGELAEKQVQFGEATEKTKGAAQALSQVGGVASQFVEGTKKRAAIKAGFEAAAAVATGAGFAASGGTAQNLLAASIQHGTAAAMYSGVASGAISGSPGGAAGGGASAGGGAAGGVSGGAAAGGGINIEQQTERSAETFARKLAAQQAMQGITINLDASGMTTLADSQETANRLLRTFDEAARNSSLGQGLGS